MTRGVPSDGARPGAVAPGAVRSDHVQSDRGPATGVPASSGGVGTLLPGDLEIVGLPNLRDVGGHPTRDGGRVRTGRLFRSVALGRVDAAGLAALARLGIRTVFDLRTAEERTASPDRLPPASAYVIADILADAPGISPARFATLFDDPSIADRELGGGRAARFFVDAYRDFVALEAARRGYGRLFAALADDGTLPALFHCTTGKDRTGWAAAVLQLFLGVPDDAVMAHYLASGPQLAPLVRPMLDAFAGRGGDPELLRPLLDVRPEYLDAALDEVARGFRSIEGYVADGLGIDVRTRAALREALVERA